MFWGDLATERIFVRGATGPASGKKNNAGKNACKAYLYITPPWYVLSLFFPRSKGAWHSSQIFCWYYIDVLFLCFCYNKFKANGLCYVQSPIHILKFWREKNSNVMQFVVLCSFLCCISCTPSIQTIRYVLRCLCRLVFRFVIVIIVVGSWL